MKLLYVLKERTPIIYRVLLLCVLHACVFAAALRLPFFIGKVTQQTLAEEAPVILEMISE